MVETRRYLAGYNHIIDDGDCTDHGFFIPRWPVQDRQIRDTGLEVSYVDVPREVLQGVLNEASANQSRQLRAAGLL